MIVLKRIALVLGGLFVSLLLISSVLLFYIASSQDGAHRAFELVQKILPGELSVTELEGRLAGPLRLRGLEYRQSDGLAVKNDQLSFDWDPASLLKGRVEIIALELSGSSITIPESQRDLETTSEPYQGLIPPLEITIERFSSDDFQITTAEDAAPVVIDHLDFKAATEDDRLLIDELSFNGLSTQLNLHGNLGLGRSLPLSLNLEWRYRLPDGPLLSGKGDIQGDAKVLHLHQQLTPPLASVVNIELRDLLTALSWRAEWVLEDVRLAEIVQELPTAVQGHLSAKGDLEQAAIESVMQFSEPTLGELSSELSAQYREGQVRITSLKLTNPEALVIEGEGLYRPEDKGLSAQMQWQRLRWPFSGVQETAHSEAGSLKIQGRLDQYNYQLDTKVAGKDLPSVEVNAKGSGDLTALKLEQLLLVHQESRVEGGGVVKWSPEVSWGMTLNGEKFNPGLVHQAFPGLLAFELTSEGGLVDKRPQAELLIKELNGILRDYPVEAEGALRYQQGVAHIEAMTFRSGPNQMNAKGEIGDKLALSWSVKAPDLAGFWPGLSGALNGEGELHGEAEAPAISMNLKGEGIAFETFEVDRFDSAVELNMAGEQPVNISLNGSKLAVGEKQWDSLSVEVDGHLPEHRLKLAMKGDQVPQLELTADAGLNKENSWQGILQQLAANAPGLGKWQLKEPVAYCVGDSDQILERLCLFSDESLLCGSYTNRKSADWRSELELSDFALKRLQRWLPDETILFGTLGLQAELADSKTGIVQGKANITTPKAGLKFNYDGQQHVVGLSGSRLTAKLDGEGAKAELKMPLKDLGGIGGYLSLPGFSVTGFDPDQQQMRGEIKGSIENLAMVSSLVPKLQNSRGKLMIDFDMNGVVAGPRLQGQARLAGGASDLPELGIELRDIELIVEADELDKLKVTGEISSGDGQLLIQGSTELNAARGFSSEYKISGQDWLAVDVPEAEIQVSPEILFTHTEKGNELRGRIKVPYARLRPRELPQTAVSVSSDMVVKQSKEQQRVERDVPLKADIRLSLGKRVSFDGFGLRGNFTGDLQVIDEPGRPVLGRGRLEIVDGVYQAYGQDLKIEQGYALFANSPVDNPGINVRAIREVGDVIAGLRVSGTLKKPKLDLFSTPAMSESDVLTYILTGRGPGESSGQTVGLAAALKASGASNLAEELGRRFGLEELRVDTGSSLEEAAIVAGTYLSPRLYVQYVNELSTSETKLRMRYDLTDRWQVEAETGRTQAGDFFYTFER